MAVLFPISWRNVGSPLCGLAFANITPWLFFVLPQPTVPLGFELEHPRRFRFTATQLPLSSPLLVSKFLIIPPSEPSVPLVVRPLSEDFDYSPNIQPTPRRSGSFDEKDSVSDSVLSAIGSGRGALTRVGILPPKSFRQRHIPRALATHRAPQCGPTYLNSPPLMTLDDYLQGHVDMVYAGSLTSLGS